MVQYLNPLRDDVTAQQVPNSILMQPEEIYRLTHFTFCSYNVFKKKKHYLPYSVQFILSGMCSSFT